MSESNSIQTIKNTLMYYIKNGVYIPFLHIALFYLTNDLFLSSIITSKLYPANYYYFFYKHYQYANFPKWVGILKQFVRFTDTGHIASFLYFFYPEFFGLAFNVHFVITFGYWCSIYFFNMKDLDDKYSPEIMTSFGSLWAAQNHILPFVLFVRELWIQPELCSHSLFSLNNLSHTYQWLYCWFIFIYIPWRSFTGDCVYSMLDNTMPVKKLSIFLVFIHSLFIAANISGALLQYAIC